MHWFTYLIAIYLMCWRFDLIESTGNNTKVTTNKHNDQLITKGFEWHPVRTKFYKNFSLTKNVFDFIPERNAQISLDLDSVKDKLKGYSFDKLEAIGHSLYVFYDGDEYAHGSYKIEHYNETERNTFRTGEWHKISDEYKITPESLYQIENVLKINFYIAISYSSIEIKNRPYIAISKMHKYLKFNNGDQIEIVHFNFTKNTNDYLVQIDEMNKVDLTQLSYWTNLNFPGVLKNNLTNLAVSKLNNSYMMLNFLINSDEEKSENSSICLKMKYYHDAHDGLTKFLILTQPKNTNNQDEKTFNKLLEYNSFRPTIYEVIQKNWLQLKICFHLKFIDENVIYLKSELDSESQLGRFPSLTNAIGDLEIERDNERNINDFLYSWQTGLYDPSEEWYTTPVLDNFKLEKKNQQTYLELVNDHDSKIDVYHLISKAFRLENNMVLTFNLLTNHTEATLNIYLVENTKRRRTLRTINMEEISDENQISIELTDSNLESNLHFNAIDLEEEMRERSYADKTETEDQSNEKEDSTEIPEKERLDDKLDRDGLITERPVTERPTDDETLNPDHRPIEEEKPIEKPLAILIFEFKFKQHLEENDKIEKLKLFNLNLMDPCYLRAYDCNHGKCKSDSIDKWHCECEETAHGENCKYWNMCKHPMNEHYIKEHGLIVSDESDVKDLVLNGGLYCAQRKAKSCLPIGDSVICRCEDDEMWNLGTHSCEKLDSCLFIYCAKNEECREDKITKKAKCHCKLNYYRNETTKECEVDYCRTDSKQRCNETQYCINDLVNERAICECKFGFGSFKHQLNECLPLFSNEQVRSPFMSQYYGCDHTYELILNENNLKEYRCKCFDGYTLQNDRKTCKPDFDIKKCPLCNVKQVCVKQVLNSIDQFKCICKLGYNEGNKEKTCEPNYCNDKSKQKLIKASCVSSGECSVQMVRRSDPLFQCVCKPELMIANRQNGICEIKNVCNRIEQDKCAEKNAYCVPQLVGTLKPVCECSIGFGKDPSTDICRPLDTLIDCKRFNAFTKYIDVKQNQAVCACLPGYEFNLLQKKCILSSKDTIQVSVVVFLKHVSDELDRLEIPITAYQKRWNKEDKIKIYDCSAPKLLSREQCYALTNAAYLPLNKLNRTLMMRNVEYQLYQKVRSLIYYIHGDNQMSVSMISFKNVSSIDENEFGFNTEYLVNIALVGGSKAKGESLQENLDKMCQEKERNDEQEYVRPERFKDFCFLDRRILPVSRKLNIVGQINLCNSKAIQCPAYSTCKHEKNESMNAYSCVCNKGFKSLHKIEEYNLNIEVCEDVDECNEQGGIHDCGMNTTCENLIGSYRCLCKENYKRLSDTDCEETCSSSFPCVHGRCTVFEKYYEICVCNDGHKGDDCSKEDPLVILLKEILVFVSVGLGLMLIVVIAIAIFCIQSVRKHRSKDEDHINLNDLK